MPFGLWQTRKPHGAKGSFREQMANPNVPDKVYLDSGHHLKERDKKGDRGKVMFLRQNSEKCAELTEPHSGSGPRNCTRRQWEFWEGNVHNLIKGVTSLPISFFKDLLIFILYV